MVMTVYFPEKQNMHCVGAMGLLEKDVSGLEIWRVYKIYPMSERSVLFQRNKNEFAVVNGKYDHEMGEITIERDNGFINVKVTVKEELLKKYGVALLEREKKNGKL